MRTHRGALVALLALLALAGPASARGAAPPGGLLPSAPTEEGVGSGEATPRPQLLLIHGGSFIFDDPNFRALTESWAIAAGFVPHYLAYPLGDVPAALARARAEARRLRRKYGADDVFGYGSSAGGTLTDLLAGDGLLAAAVAKAPVTDLVGWEWPLTRYGEDYYERIGLDLAARYRLSPLRRPQRRPLLLIQGRDDRVVAPAMSEAFAAKFKRVHLWEVPGGHTTERTRPYLITRAMRWLANEATRTALMRAR